MTRHLEPVPEPDEATAGPWSEGVPGDPDEELLPLRRPAWWRWVAIVVVVAMVVATPVAYGLYLLLR